ncbi:MAG: universal stress protein [Chloroflexi bacterium]|nr:universal stress protein [Chloroflexota bacterium]
MFRILLATDGSAFSLRAAEYVAKMFHNKHDAEVSVLYVEEINPMLLSPTSAASLPPMPIPPAQVTDALVSIKEHMERERTAALEATTGRFVGFGGGVSSRSAQGKPGDVICDIGERENFDLIVVGSSGKGRVSRAFLGSVSYRVVNQARVPVLVVRGKD